MNIENLIIENKLILIPVLIVLGSILKKARKIPDKFLPIILLGIGIVLSVLSDTAFSLQSIVQSIIQGILVADSAVLGNQISKQLKKMSKTEANRMIRFASIFYSINPIVLL